jgi:hypothetical protein
MKLDPEIAAIYEAPLTRAEFESRLAEALRSIEGPEGDELASLIAWFQRAYPTAKERLSYCRRKMRQMEESSRLPD